MWRKDSEVVSYHVEKNYTLLWTLLNYRICAI